MTRFGVTKIVKLRAVVVCRNGRQVDLQLIGRNVGHTSRRDPEAMEDRWCLFE